MRGVFGEIGFNGVVEVLGCVSDAAKNTELKKYLGVAFAAVGTADELDVAMVGIAPTEWKESYVKWKWCRIIDYYTVVLLNNISLDKFK